MVSFRIHLLTLLFTLLCAASGILAQQAQQAPASIYTDTKDGYKYHGCYNETTALQDTSGARALYNGKNEVKPGEMTVQRCQTFCNDGQFRYAGLEFSKECWCAQQLSGISAKLDDEECDMPCDGDKSQVCGGALKLTVYIAGAAAPSLTAGAALWVACLAAGVVALGLI
ncbi:WSC domain containing protein [Rhypophila decipiens]